MEECCFLTGFHWLPSSWSANFLKQLRSVCLGWSLHVHQQSRQFPTELAIGQSDLGIPSTKDPSGDFGLCQVDS